MGLFSAVNPALLWGGVLIASPILIHLLSKRKFVVIEWAAMAFLLDAQKHNRRRIRLEHLILLMLRCLAILLLAALVARPVFDPSGLGEVKLGSHEHLILLDDSPSMSASVNNQTALAEAKGSIVSFIRTLSRERAGDSVTLLLTSRPNRPLVAGNFVSAENVEELVSAVELVEASAFPARFDSALLAVEKLISESAGEANRTCYIVSDFRQPDWIVGKDRSRGAVAILKRIGAGREKISFVDFGKGRDQNVTVAAITPPAGTLVAGVPARFEVTVVNRGTADVDGVEVNFVAGNSLPLRKTIANIAPGGSAVVPFTFTFHDAGSVAVQASIGTDALPIDNTCFRSAHVVEGVSVLIVDGEPSGSLSRSESYYLERALAPRGSIPSGYVVEVIAESQLESAKLSRYQLIALCNLPVFTDKQAKKVTEWVKGGGGLVWFLGDQVDAPLYNNLHTSYPGIMPLELVEIAGDETEESWVTFGKMTVTHPVLRMFEGEAFLRKVKFFQWWKTRMPEKSDTVKLLAQFDEPDNSPAIVQQSLGDGKILIFCTAADAEWGIWVSDPSYVVAMQEMARHLARRITAASDIGAGDPLRLRIDPALHSINARIYPPNRGNFDAVQAVPMADGETMEFTYEETNSIGLYRMLLSLQGGGEEEKYFAINVDENEGVMARVKEWAPLLGEAKVDFAMGGMSISGESTGGRIQLWRPILLALILVLCFEQLLAWYFGTKR